MRAVGDAVNDARHDEPDCLEPAAPAAHSVLSVAFSMTTGERRAVLGVDRGSAPMRWATSMPAHHAAEQRVVGRQLGVVAGDDEELAARRARRLDLGLGHRDDALRVGEVLRRRLDDRVARAARARCRAGRRPG